MGIVQPQSMTTYCAQEPTVFFINDHCQTTNSITLNA